MTVKRLKFTRLFVTLYQQSVSLGLQSNDPMFSVEPSKRLFYPFSNILSIIIRMEYP